MKSVYRCCFAVALLAAALTAPAQAGDHLRAFASESEFQRWLADLERKRQLRPKPVHEVAPSVQEVPPAPVAPAPAQALQSVTLDSVQIAGSRAGPDAAGADAITNVQTQGVDEGDVVKKRGDHLIVLRRGRLFTVAIGGDRLQPVSAVDAFPPGSDPDGTWYDEMLVSENSVVVIGYSYQRGGTEIGLFDLSPQGRLRYRASYQLRGSDYYSASNYASRLIGRTLIFYAPVELWDLEETEDQLPALRRWREGTPPDFQRILPANRIYRSPGRLDPDDLVLHTVNRCELGDGAMQCSSAAVLGPQSRSFYVSEDAVYVWTHHDGVRPGRPNAAVFRLPLDGTAPTALRASGGPYDQMSFLQRDGWLNVLVSADSDGEGMWSSRSRSGDLALLRVPLKAFGDGRGIARHDDYRRLPGVGLEQGDLHVRFIGDWLLFGGSERWQGKPAPRRAYALRYASAAAPSSLELSHALERIDALGDDAVLVGAEGGDLHFSSVRLDRKAQLAGHYVQERARQGDDRSHGFFYQPETAGQGLLGLPILGQREGRDSASVLYLRNQALTLSRLGTLEARADPTADDGCRVSCVDWYGNARPIFVGTRVFALLGYELVEGEVDRERIRERRRTDFSPRPAIAAGAAAD